MKCRDLTPNVLLHALGGIYGQKRYAKSWVKGVYRLYPDAHPELLFDFTAPGFVAAAFNRQRFNQ